MREALKARRTGSVLVLCVTLGIVAAVMAGVEVPVPFLSSLGNAALPFPVITGLVLAIVLPSAARAAEPQSVGSYRRNAVGHTIGFVAAAVGVYGVVGAGLTAWLSPEPGLAWLIVSDAVCLVALSTAVRWIWPAPALAAIPVALVVLQSLFARDNVGAVRPWAWLMTREWCSSVGAVGVCGWTAVIVSAAVSAVLACTRRPLFGRAEDDPLVPVA
ncbi:MAG: hypothetical protein ACTH9H_11405 [Galactobacter sp.]